MIILIAGVLFVVNSKNVSTNNNITNNTTNNTTTKELNITNWTLSNDSKESSNAGQSSSSPSKQSSSEPEYNSEEYVQKWDQSQQGGGSWAYTHSQPTKTGEDGHHYKRMYNPDTGESYWGYMY